MGWRKSGVRKGKRGRGKWTQRGGERIRETEGWDGGEDREINEELGLRIKQIGEELKEGEKESTEARRRGWWDEECGDKRKEVWKVLRKWRKEGGSGEEYRKLRGEYKLLCKRKKEEENGRWLREAQEARTEGEVWQIVNRERKCWKGINEMIKMEEWKGHFMRLLGGVEGKVVRGGVKRILGEEEGEIDRGELKRVIERLKKGKASGADGVPNEVWKLGGERIEEWAWRFCNRVWRGEGWPEQWKDGVIVPLVKKGGGERVEEYRGVTLMPTLYKVYVGVLTGRLKEEMEEKAMLPP
ncbi:endonuclease-reverse transcriptase, partial [Lasius niger]